MAKLYTITLNGVTEDTYNQATDYIQKNALRLNYRPVASTIDVEFPDDIDPDKARTYRRSDPRGASDSVISLIFTFKMAKSPSML